jgi:outer membrane protein TolC
MPKLSDYRRDPELAPVRPPILPPDFPDIPQNPSSELQPPPDPPGAPDKVAGTMPAPDEPGEADMTKDELRRKNVRLREKINSVLEQHPELRDATDEIVSKQGTQVKVGTPFLERIEANLQERARAIIERRPDLEHLFDD